MCANCHVVSMAIDFTDLPSIKAACQRMGWNFLEGQKTYRWFGQWVDDSPVPRHIFATQEEYDKVVAMNRGDRQKYMTDLLGKCSHAISVPGARYDIGLIERDGQFIPVWDWFGSGGLNRDLRNQDISFAQAYGVERTRLQAQSLCHQVTETKLDSGWVTRQKVLRRACDAPATRICQ